MRKKEKFRERKEEEATTPTTKRDDDERTHPLNFIVDSTMSLTNNEINSNSVAAYTHIHTKKILLV